MYQIDHVNGGGTAARKAGVRSGALYRAVLVDDASRYQLLCANCNTLKKYSAKEVRPRDTYIRNPAKGRRPVRQYLSSEQISELARRVAVDGLPQADVAAQYGLTQPTVARHVKNHYPTYNGRQMRVDRTAHETLKRTRP